MNEIELSNLVEEFSIGVVQTSLDFTSAWANGPKMSKSEEEWAIHEIRKFIAALHQERVKKDSAKVDIILLPELSVPVGFVNKLRSIATQLETIIIAGLDYNVYPGSKKVSNEAVIVVPNKWRKRKIHPKTTVRYIGKTYPAPKEKENLEAAGFEFVPSPDVWIFDGKEIGKFGVAICYDLLDLDRLAMYRGRIQHLFILAYNRDINSFDHAAEAMARMIFCTVTICNCGYYGGSLSVAPYREVHRRTIYRHFGANLATAQVITLPVKSLAMHQAYKGTEFKNLPPGYRELTELSSTEEKI